MSRSVSTPTSCSPSTIGAMPTSSSRRIFALLGSSSPLEVTMKVGAEEREIGMLLPFVRPASYVGRYGWVTVTVADQDALDTALEWVRESYFLKAPAKLREAAFR